METLVANETAGGALGETKCTDVVAGEAGDAKDVRILDNGGGAGVANPERVVVSVVPAAKIKVVLFYNNVLS